MPETFLMLLGAGVMLAAAVSDPRGVTLRWLRLAGIIALTMAALSAYFFSRRLTHSYVVLIPLMVMTLCVFAQLAFVQVAFRRTQRALAGGAFVAGVVAGAAMLITILPAQAFQRSHALLALGAAFTSAAAGLSLMDMLLGHAYLNSAQMTMKPFVRLNRVLGASMAGRTAISLAAALLVQSLWPIELFWNLFALYIGTRWLVGLILPGIFVWMAHDCIKRRATQSATGILYVAGTLIFIGEIISLWLMSQTGLPL